MLLEVTSQVALAVEGAWANIAKVLALGGCNIGSIWLFWLLEACERLGREVDVASSSEAVANNITRSVTSVITWVWQGI